MIDLKKHFAFSLTSEQSELTQKLLEFIDSEDDIFILKGYAGTGKTSIMKGLVKHFAEIKRPFALMASTGRAAKVLSEKAGFTAATIHSTIYALQIVEVANKDKQEDEANYRISFRLKLPNVNSKTIYFIDESSMITNSIQSGGSITFGTGRLIDDLFRFKGDGKVVFIGDAAQLPPVNSKFSAALSSDFFASVFNKKADGYELKQVMRYNANSGMFFNTQHLREVILSNRYPPLAIKAFGLDDITVCISDNEMVQLYYKTVKQLGVESSIYITLSNKQAAIVNEKMRIHLWGYQNKDILKKNESLMVVRNNYLFNLSNGDLITVDKIEDDWQTKAGLQFKYIHIRTYDSDPAKGMIIKRVLVVMDLLSSAIRDLSLEQDMELLKNYFARMRHFAIELYEIIDGVSNIEKRRNEIESKVNKSGIIINIDQIIEKKPSKKAFIKQVAYDNMTADPYLNALRVKYGYAITCHKAQGSEWPHVFVHLERSLFSLDKENQYRWTYTALSRAEKHLYLSQNFCLY